MGFPKAKMGPKQQSTETTRNTKPQKASEPKKRKAIHEAVPNGHRGEDKQRESKRVKMFATNARTILTQTSDAALRNGDLDVSSFLRSREFEIKALQNGMQKAKAGLNGRAFQQVPREMRRRTASHNVKRVPKRLQQRAKREMLEDNTPTVTPNRRKPRSSRGRIRAETAKRLGLLAAKKRSRNEKAGTDEIETRTARPKLRQGLLNDPPKPKAKFRKRQIHKTWLPTHLWHAKRAKMTEPKSPLWRFSVPLTSTEKSYRPTHRAAGGRGAMVWDMSYISTICLEGGEASLEQMLKAVGVNEPGLWGEKGQKWRSGRRFWSGWLTKETDSGSVLMGPSSLLWCSPEIELTATAANFNGRRAPTRRIFLRIHPAAFHEVWIELLRMSKLQHPVISIQDLRFEIGSIDITGPGSTETLCGILHPYHQGKVGENHANVFNALAGLTNPASLPSNAVLFFDIMDPRLNYPPRSVNVSTASADPRLDLLRILSEWPADEGNSTSGLFDRDTRFKATRLPSQKSINRRKAVSGPGTYPPLLRSDPSIPIILLANRMSGSSSEQGTWTLLAPWKCILPLWYGLVHYPLSSGGNPRFGGLQEIRQLHFERNTPWFPADYPGTQAGFMWENDQRLRRKAAWDKKPKGKRVEYGSLDLGSGRKGEIGRGWACDFEKICGRSPLPSADSSLHTNVDVQPLVVRPPQETKTPIHQMQKKNLILLLSSLNGKEASNSAVATIHLTLTSRGIATQCARIYRLPLASLNKDFSTSGTSKAPTTREQWLSFLPSSKSKSIVSPKSCNLKRNGRIPLNVPLPQRVRLLAQSLLQEPPMRYSEVNGEADTFPPVPDEEDLIGFVTTGEFSLTEGRGVAIGSVIASMLLHRIERVGKHPPSERLCIVRNAGEKVGRLAHWKPI